MSVTAKLYENFIMMKKQVGAELGQAQLKLGLDIILRYYDVTDLLPPPLNPSRQNVN